MKEQRDPITDDEWILRRVHLESFDSVDRPKINLYAFKPTVKGTYPDVTGISFYRQSCIEHVQDILVKTDEAKRRKYGVVRIPLTLLDSLGLVVVRDDDTEQPVVFGHVIMPAINSIVYSADKNSVLPKMKALADYVNEHQEFVLLPDPPN